MTRPTFDSGLTYDDLERVCRVFGVAESQVIRDHLISHLLAAISAADVSKALVFFGGTALCRSFLPEHRLSEDIDLLVRADHDRKSVAQELQVILTRATARTHGPLRWSRALADSPARALASTDDGVSVQIQLLRATDYSKLPTADIGLDQRYSDVPPARLAALTQEAFVVAKTTAWLDRNTPRDLYDLWAMANRGMINAGAAELYLEIGPTGSAPSDSEFPQPPGPESWRAELGHQCRLSVDPATAFDRVRHAWRTAKVATTRP